MKAPIDNVFPALRTETYKIDDSKIWALHVHKAVDRKRPRLEMIVSQHRPKESREV